MHKIEVIEAKKIFMFPEDATEFSREQTILFARYALFYQAQQITFQQLKTYLTFNFLNLKRNADLSIVENQAISENINIISKLTEAYFQDTIIKGQQKKAIKMDFFMQKIPTINIDGVNFHGPTDVLFNTVYGEYLQLINHFLEYSQTNSMESLDAMIATIYRPEKDNHNHVKTLPDYDGDIRKKYNPNLTPHYITFISKLSLEVKYAIYLYVASCQNYIINADALDIGGGKTLDLTLLFSGGGKNDSPLGSLGTLHSIAETKIFGTIKEVAEQNTFDIFAFLVNQTLEYKKLKRNASSN